MHDCVYVGGCGSVHVMCVCVYVCVFACIMDVDVCDGVRGKF